jgi:zinc protease
MKSSKIFQNIIPGGFVIAACVILAVPAIFAQPSLPSPKQEKLLNELKLFMWSDTKADKVNVRLRIHSGSAFDPQGREGVMQLLADNFFPNPATREFFVEDLGGSLDVVTNYDYIQINASSKPEGFLQMLETIATAVSNPAIDKETTIKLRAALLARVKALESDPSYVADQAVSKRLFGTFPYGRPQLGTSQSIQKIDFADLLDAKQRFLTADNATIAITGNFDRDQAYRAVRRYFGQWLKSDKKVPSAFKQPDDPPVGQLTIPSPAANISALRFAIRGSARGAKDFAASKVVTTILEQRIKIMVPSGQSSSVFVNDEAYLLPGIIKIGLGGVAVIAPNNNGDKVAMYDVVAKPRSQPITQSEFDAARSLNAAAWRARPIEQLWLDADTYRIKSVDADAAIFDSLTLADAQAFLEKIQKLSVAMVLLNGSPAT